MPIQSSDVSNAVVSGQQLFRINQLLLPGDIFQFDGSVQSVGIGPDSDVPDVNLLYLDKTLTPFGANSVNVSAARPWQWRLDARLDDQYPNGGGAQFDAIKGRLIAYSPAIVVPNFTPLEVGATSITTTINPRIDLIASFQPGAPAVQRRSPFIYRSLAEVAADPSFFVFPFYGRRTMAISAVQYIAAGVYTMQVRGHNFMLPASATVGTDPLVGTTSLLAATALGAPGQLNFVVDAQVHGAFDMVSVAIAGPASSGAVDPPPVSVKVEARDE